MSDEKRADAIKNCPCCGGKAKLFKKRSYFQFFIVGCTECGLRTDDMPAVEKAIERWNTRKPIDRIVEQLEKEKGIYFDGLPCEGMKIRINDVIALVKAGEVDG